MKKLVLIFSLIVVLFGLYNHDNNIFPAFTDEEIQFICNEEGLL